MFILLALPLWHQNWAVLGFTLASLVFGPIVYFMLVMFRKRCKDAFLGQEEVQENGAHTEKFHELNGEEFHSPMSVGNSVAEGVVVGDVRAAALASELRAAALAPESDQEGHEGTLVTSA